MQAHMEERKEREKKIINRNSAFFYRRHDTRQA